MLCQAGSKHLGPYRDFLFMLIQWLKDEFMNLINSVSFSSVKKKHLSVKQFIIGKYLINSFWLSVYFLYEHIHNDLSNNKDSITSLQSNSLCCVHKENAVLICLTFSALTNWFKDWHEQRKSSKPSTLKKTDVTTCANWLRFN